MKYTGILLLLLVIGCASVEESKERQAATKIHNIISDFICDECSSGQSPYFTDDWHMIRDRILRGEDTLFYVSTRKFEILVSNKMGEGLKDIVEPDTTADATAPKPAPKKKGAWEER